MFRVTAKQTNYDRFLLQLLDLLHRGGKVCLATHSGPTGEEASLAVISESLWARSWIEDFQQKLKGMLQ